MTSRALIIPALIACVGACKSNPAPAPAASAEKTTAPAATACADTSSSEATLDAMDGRKPVALIPMMANHQKMNMRDHLLAVQQIIAGVADKDFAAVQTAAGRIGYSEQMGMMCQHMGAAAPGFTDAALKFHHTADGIAAAAKESDADGVMKALAATLQTCTDCHKTYRQSVVDEATWSKLAGQAPPMSPMHGP